jgi:hypothetical protein
MHPSRYAPACFFIACLYPSSLTPCIPTLQLVDDGVALGSKRVN